MPPNIVEPAFPSDSTPVPCATKSQNVPPQQGETNYNLYIFQSTLNLLAHLLIGIVVGISFLFSLRNGLPLGPTPLHIILCVVGHQLLMAESILSLSSDNGWSQKLKLVDKRRAHWILQILGSGIALAGSFIKIVDKQVHWNTYHGQFALVAMVFTIASLVNGLTSLYAYEFRKFLNGTISKLTHICFGVVAFAASSISLCYGFDKNFFKAWATEEFTHAIIAFTAALTFIVIINPCITFFSKAVTAVKK
ncbi:transmembrane reductase CYB561D2-like [Battus philenor]|uniref:transmembrane reductase CYB561D2-like n=1 Tax=Battus philenor TaxID=42288 RepID=UPI0035CEBBAC